MVTPKIGPPGKLMMMKSRMLPYKEVSNVIVNKSGNDNSQKEERVGDSVSTRGPCTDLGIA
jgi:hypothetical protein